MTAIMLTLNEREASLVESALDSWLGQTKLVAEMAPLGSAMKAGAESCCEGLPELIQKVRAARAVPQPSYMR